MLKYPLGSITIDGFRGLKTLRLDDLRGMNILVGENNSGKTSVLEALSILCDPLDPYEWLAMVRRRDYGRLDETRVQSLRWCFRQSGELADPDLMFEAECRMSNIGAFPLRKLTATYRDIVGEPDPKELRYSLGRGRTTADELSGPQEQRGAEITHRIESDSILHYADGREGEPIVARVWEQQMFYPVRGRSRRDRVPNVTLTPYSYQINQFQVRLRSHRVFDRRSDMVLELVSDFDSEIEAVEIASFRGERPAIYLNHRQLGPAPLSVFGDGLRRAVMLASTLPTLEGGGLLLIDEIETGIHVSVLRHVFDWLRRWALQLKVQVVATTHSLEALDAIALSTTDNLSDLVTYHLEQTESGTQAKRIDGELLLRLRRERGLDVR